MTPNKIDDRDSGRDTRDQSRYGRVGPSRSGVRRRIGLVLGSRSPRRGYTHVLDLRVPYSGRTQINFPPPSPIYSRRYALGTYIQRYEGRRKGKRGENEGILRGGIIPSW